MQSSVALTHGRFASPRFALIFLPMLLAAALTPRSYAQVTYTGTAAAQNFGSQAVGVASTAVSFPFSIGAGTTVGSIAVLTQSSPNLDFASAAGTTCSAQTYTSASTCTVKVTFTPEFAGYRTGAIVFFSGSGNTGTVLGSAPLEGVGNGAQIAYQPSVATVVASQSDGVGGPNSLAVDGAGDIFVGETGVLDLPAGGGQPTAIDPTANGVAVSIVVGLAIDGAGDLFIADEDNNRAVEVPVGGGSAIVVDPTVDGLGLHGPAGIAVDSAGDLFISDGNNHRVVKVPVGGGAATSIDPTVNGLALSFTENIAIDSAGDLFITDYPNDRVIEVPVGGGAAIAIDPPVDGRTLSAPLGVAVGPTGDLFIADCFNARVVEVPSGGGPAVALSPVVDGLGLWGPDGVAIDSAGDLFIADYDNNRVIELDNSKAPNINFPTATAVGSADTADGKQTVQITNIGNEPLAFSALAYPPDFSEAPGDSAACTASTVLDPEQSCDLPIQFTPKSPGQPLTEAVTFADNAPAAGGHQSIAVSGTATAVITSPKPGSTFPGSTVTFTWSAIPGSSEYALRIGTGPGGNNLYQSPVLTATTDTVTSLPTMAQKVYVQLDARINGVWQSQNYTYYEQGTAVQAQLTSPIAEYVGASQTFTWSAGTTVSEYFFQVGTDGVGSHNVLNTGVTSALSATVTGLPAGGEKLYVRLGSKINGAWQTIDYVYYTYTLPYLESPNPGSSLTGTTVTFDWTWGEGPSEYALRLGSTYGANDLFQSPILMNRVVTVTGLPTNGETIYATLGGKINGTWYFTYTTYTAF